LIKRAQKCGQVLTSLGPNNLPNLQQGNGDRRGVAAIMKTQVTLKPVQER